MKYMLTPHNRWFLAVLLAVMLLLPACSVRPTSSAPKVDRKPFSKESFLLDPFGYEPSKANFQNNLPASFKLQVYTLKNKAGTKDTIIRFYHRKSEIYCFKTARGAEKLMSLHIYDDEPVFANGVHAGMTRAEFNACFTNLETDQNDTVKIIDSNIRYTYSFLFKSGKLKVIKAVIRKEK